MHSRNRAAQASQRIRLRLAASQAGTALSFLGLVAGLLAGGLSGATIFIGAMVGRLFVDDGNVIGLSSGYGLFVMLGMGAMMSAVLQAPLAGHLATLNLTAIPLLILPAMMAVASVDITAKEIVKQHWVFSMIMRDAGLDYRHDPIAQSLRRIAVTAVMNRNFVASETEVDPAGVRPRTVCWEAC